MITIKEMANIIGVSPTTVSNVIHGKTKEVSPELTKRIQEVIREYNYIPNMSASNLAKNNSRVIGFIMHTGAKLYNNDVQDFFTSELLGEIEKGVRCAGYYLMLYISDQTEAIHNFVRSWNVDGIIALGFKYDAASQLQQVFDKPMVFIDGYFYDDQEYVNVGLEDYQSGYDITKEVLSYGHRHIVFASDNLSGVDGMRYEGCKKAVYDWEDDVILEHVMIERSMEGIQNLAHSIKEKIGIITAVIFASDSYAVSVMGILLDQGLQIPKDLSMIGFDDTPMSTVVRPQLTTVHQSTGDKAKVAIQKLLPWIETGKKPMSVRMNCYPVIRESLGKIEKR